MLYYFAKLTDHLQEDNVSCVEAVLIVEHYLRIIKQNIVKFNIGQAGKDLYYFMKKRLISHIEKFEINYLVLNKKYIYKAYSSSSSFESLISAILSKRGL